MHTGLLSPTRIHSGAVFFVLRSFSLSLFPLLLDAHRFFTSLFSILPPLSLLLLTFYAARKLHKSQSPQSETGLSALDHISAQRTTLVTVL